MSLCFREPHELPSAYKSPTIADAHNSTRVEP
jgi:hypothetical protein